MSVCDSCVISIKDDGLLGDVDDDTAEFIAIELGAEVPDHICETVDNPEANHCDCGCH